MYLVSVDPTDRSIVNENKVFWKMSRNIRKIFVLKFGLSEKHTKFEKNLPNGFEKSADLLK